MSLKEERSIDEYFETLLDVSVQEHRNFLNEYKHRVVPKKGKPNNRNKGNETKPQREPNKKSKEPSQPEKPPANSETSKKKNKFVSLYDEHGKMNDVVMLKGRHLCNCEAAKHKLINNCIQCGRIVCEQEGSGPCLFCGNLVCTEDEQRIIESSSQNGENLKKNLIKQGRPKGWEEALAMRNRLLDYDRMSEKRTTVIDDESDYFRTNSVWLSDEERAKLKKIEDKVKEQKNTSRRFQKVTIDFTGRQVIDESPMGAQFEDEILKEIADTFSNSNQGLYAQKGNVNFDNMEDCDPNLTFPQPIVSVIRWLDLLSSKSFQLSMCCSLMTQFPINITQMVQNTMAFTIAFKTRNCSRSPI